jgi:hypothetical protein
VILTLGLTYIWPETVTYLPDVFFNKPVDIPFDPNDGSIVNPDIFKSF